MSLKSFRILDSLFPVTDILVSRSLASQVMSFNIHDISETPSIDR